MYGGLHTDRAGRLWAGTDLGVQVFEQGRFRVVEELRDLTRGPYEAMAMHQDRRGVMWIGTYGGKLIRYQDGVPTVYTRKDGMAGDDIKVTSKTLRRALTALLWPHGFSTVASPLAERDGLPVQRPLALCDADCSLWSAPTTADWVV